MYRNVLCIPWRLSLVLLLAMTCSFLLGGQLGSLSNLLNISGDEILQLYEYSQGAYKRNMMEEENTPEVTTRSFTLDDPPPLRLRDDPALRYIVDGNGQKREIPENVARILERRRIERASKQTTLQKILVEAESAPLNQKKQSQSGTVSMTSLRNGNAKEIQNQIQSNFETSLLGDRKVSIQPLLQWEKTAIETRICQTPHRGIPKHCCPGSFSAGGRLLFVEDVCNRTEEYEKVQDHSLEYLKNPHLAINGPTTDQQCDACVLVETLMDRNLTLSFVGDSLTRQSIAGLECELLRRGYMVRSKKMPITKRSGCTWRDCLGEWVVFTVTSKNSAEVEETRIAATIHHFGMYRPDRNNLDLKEVILPNSDIVIFDHGLHWKPTEQARFGEAMTRYLKGFLPSNLTLLAWRETSAQHMDAEGGHYGSITTKKSKDCVPIHPEHQTGFRMPIMRRAAETAGLQWMSLTNFSSHAQKTANELVFLPFRDYTVPLHYLHPNECTHYCHTPYLWLPLWRSLRIALDRAVSKN